MKVSGKIAKRTGKSILVLLLAIIRLLLVAYLLLQSNPVQKMIIDYITGYFSEKLQTRIEIGKVDIGLFNRVIFEDVYVEDQNTDTLMYVSDFVFELDEISFDSSAVYIEKLLLGNAYINAIADTGHTFNYQFIIDYFVSGEKDTSASSWSISCRNVGLTGSRINYFMRESADEDGILNFDRLSVKDLNVEVGDFQMEGDTFNFSIKEFNFFERSGFAITTLFTDVKMTPENIELNDFTVHTGNSHLNTRYFVLSYKNLSEDFSDFLNRVKIDAEIVSSQIGLDDLAFFSSSLKGLNQNVFINGKIKGKISKIKLRDFELFYGEATHMKGDISIDGLPDIENSFIYADFNELVTTVSDIEQIPLPPFDEHSQINLPEEVRRFGKIFYTGNFTGFVYDFVTYGNFSTMLGNIATDISIKQDTSAEKVSFTGHLTTENFKLGKMLGKEQMVGQLSMKINVDGHSFLNRNYVAATVKGKINNIELLNYPYVNMDIEGDLVNAMFDGLLKVDDPNIKMDFLGRCDFNEKVPVFDFTTDISHIDFYKLNIDTTDTLSMASMLLTAKFEGDELDSIIGSFDMFNVSYTNRNGTFHINSLQASSRKSGGNRTVTVFSDVLDATAEGKFSFSTLETSFTKLINRYLPALVSCQNDSKENSFGDELKFSVTIKNINDIAHVFLGNLQIDQGIAVSGYFSSRNDSLNMTVTSPEIIMNDIKYTGLEGKVDTKSGKCKTDIQLENISLSEDMNIRNTFIRNVISDNRDNITISWNNMNDSSEYSGEFYAQVDFSKAESDSSATMDITFNPSMIVIDNQPWYINDCSFRIDSSMIYVDRLTFNNEQQYFFANGIISENPADTLRVIFNDIKLSNLNNLIRKYGVSLDGIFSGEAKLNNLYANATAITNLYVDSLSVNDHPLGRMTLVSAWDNMDKKISIDASTQRGSLKTLVLNGGYYVNEDRMDMKLSLDKLRMNILDPFLEGTISKVRGIASGEAFITGKPDDPDIKGLVQLQKVSFTVDYLNTRYNFTNDIKIATNSFSFDSAVFYDVYGNQAIVNGMINHKKFENINFNVKITTDNFLFMNTSEIDNELFYGKAFASGVIDISGNPENIVMNVNAKTEKYYSKLEKKYEYTKFYIPLYTSEDVEENNFITFISTEMDTVSGDKYKVDLSGIKLNFDLEVTPDAEVQIIFDSKVGDVVKARGNANLNMEINTLGTFAMKGEYVIEEGDYLFTLQNVINKKFDVEKGGYIKWNGDPYNGVMDISAIYRLKTSLYDLTLDTGNTSRVPVECYLHMTGNLLTPDINFNIQIPTGSEEAGNLIEKMTEDEVNKQVLSLLVLNRFYTPPSLTGANPTDEQRTSAVGVTSSELLSNQLSHWLSQISNDFDVGVKYRPGDELTSDELEVALSTQLLNDRVSINGNVGMGGQYSNASGIVGDVVVDVKINKSGKMRVKGFNKANNNIIYEESPYTQGLGLFYREEFDTVGELWRRYWKSKSNKNE
ncbi:MAG: translocation/assembly module TamB domain-containing protein [Bacteroidota bacterium]